MRARGFVLAAGAAGLVVGGAALVGALLGTAVVAGPAAGASLVLAGASLLLATPRDASRARRAGARTAAALAGLAALLTVGDGAPATTLGLLLLALALVSLDAALPRRPSELLGLGAILAALVPLAGHVFGAHGLHGETSLPVAGVLLLLGVGTLAARPQVNVASLFTGDVAEASIVRRLIAGAAALVGFGVAAMVGAHVGLYGQPAASAFVAVVGMAVAITLVFATARSLRRAEAERRRADEREHVLRDRMERVGEASRAVTDALATLPNAGLRDVLHVIVREARSITGAEYAALGIGDDPERPFDPFVWSGIDEATALAIGRVPRAVGLFAVVARAERPLRLADLRAHPAFSGFPAHHPPMSSLLGVPIRFRGRAVGNLYLANKRGAAEFSDDDLRATEMLAGRVASAIEIARLNEAESLARAWLRSAIDRMPEGVLVVDGAGRIVCANHVLSLLAHDDGRTDPFGNSLLLDLRRPSGEPLPWDEAPLVRALRDGTTISAVEVGVAARDGRVVPMLASAAPIPRDGVGGVVAVFQDITGLKEMERLREEWMSVIAHDLRQPVGVIKLGAEVLPEIHGGTLTPREVLVVDRIREASIRLTEMINDLLDVSRIEARRLVLDRRALELGPLLREIVERLAHVHAGHSVEIVERGRAIVSVDPGRIEQVLGNLLSNAAKYGDPGTPILVEVAASDHEVEVSVVNHGRGVAPDELPRLFERFSRGRRETAPGIGLGLYITRGLVEAHGGRVAVESVPGQTTTFRFALPLAADSR